MALIKTLAELKAIFPRLVSNLDEDAQLPNFDTVEIKYLVPVIGMGLYNDIQTKYNANNLSASETALLKHMQLLVAANTFRDELIINQVLLTDQGWKTFQTAEMGKLVGWEFKELKSYLVDKALDAEEVLLAYLWANKADYALWTASDEYKQFTSLLIRTGTDFKKQYKSLHQPMRTYYALQAVASDVQEMHLYAGVGEDLLNYLKGADAPTETEKKCIDLLKKAMAFFTISKACNQLPVRISDAGLTVSSQYGDKEDADSAGREGAAIALIEKLQKDSEKDGQNYLSKARYELYQYRKSTTSGADFNTAFDKGPLTGYVVPGDRTSGNEDRKIFVL
jgi:hypothetical protein